MNVNGLIVGIGTFLLIGIFHVVVIKSEFYFGKEIWFLFAGMGIAAIALSTATQNVIISSLVAVFGITCLWSVKELFEQEKRVKKGWFPSNPNRKRKSP